MIVSSFISGLLFNISQRLIDCAFLKAEDAEAYVKELNGDRARAVARCKELIARYDGEPMVKFLDEEGGIAYVVMTAEMK